MAIYHGQVVSVKNAQNMFVADFYLKKECETFKIIKFQNSTIEIIYFHNDHCSLWIVINKKRLNLSLNNLLCVNFNLKSVIKGNRHFLYLLRLIYLLIHKVKLSIVECLYLPSGNIES